MTNADGTDRWTKPVNGRPLLRCTATEWRKPGRTSKKLPPLRRVQCTEPRGHAGECFNRTVFGGPMSVPAPHEDA